MPSSRATRSRTAAPRSDRRPRSIALLLTLGVCAAACSSVDSSGTAAPTTEAPAVSAVGESTSTSTSTTAAPTTSTTEATTTTALADRPLPDTPEALAVELTEAERSLRDPAVDTETGRQWGRRLQQLYLVLTSNEDWAEPVVAAVGDDIRPDVEANLSARRHLSSLVTSTALAETVPAWRIDEPLPVDELLGYYREAEAATGVPWEILASINLIETRMGRIEGLSTAGAVGPMQFLPSTWEGCCEGDPTVDRDAIMGAAVYLTLVGAPDDMDGAIFSYNRSNDYVEAVKDYAAVMTRNELAYRGYHAYEVYFRSAAGLLVLEPGYFEPEPVDVVAWIAAHPEAFVSE